GLGSLGAVFGKLTFEGPMGMVAQVAGGPAAELCLRAVTLLGVFAPNAAMWHCYVSALQGLPTVHAAIINTVANIVCSAIWGALLFAEPLSLRWALGSLLMAAGLAAMTAAAPHEVPAPATPSSPAGDKPKAE
ncbi:uncharacterized protein AMSG_11579, partial [Thecamonas trahens ATCC 50062]